MTITDLHPMVIHFPIALLTMSILCDGAGIMIKNTSLLNAGEWNLNFGLLFAIVGIITGTITDGDFGHMDNPFPIFSTHGSVQILSILGFSGLWVWRKKIEAQMLTSGKPYIIIGALLVGMLHYGSHLGALLSGRI
jgi:uncharacterized membrane protein